MNLLDTPSVVLCQGRHFNAEIIPLCVRWSVTDKLSDRELVAIMVLRFLP
jgi:transposase-like protein